MSNDSLTGNRTPVRHQLCDLIGPGHVTAGNPSSLRIVIAIVWLGTRIAISFAISLSQIRDHVAGLLLKAYRSPRLNLTNSANESFQAV